MSVWWSSWFVLSSTWVPFVSLSGSVDTLRSQRGAPAAAPTLWDVLYLLYITGMGPVGGTYGVYCAGGGNKSGKGGNMTTGGSRRLGSSMRYQG